MAYEYPGDGSLDYFPCRYGKSRLLFRGPRRDLSQPYIAVLGGTETYGKFVAEPYPALLEPKLGRRVVNLGLPNAGPDVYLKDHEALEIASEARLTVVHIMGAQNLSNRYYSVHPRRNDRFVAASPLLQSMFREVDFTEFHFTRHLLGHLHKVSPDRFEVLAEELRARWVQQMKSLIRVLTGRVVLLWTATHGPPEPGRRADLQSDPLLVDSEMIGALKPLVRGYVEVRPSAKARASGTTGMALGPLDLPAAEGLPGPAIHSEIAEALARSLKKLR